MHTHPLKCYISCNCTILYVSYFTVNSIFSVCALEASSQEVFFVVVTLFTLPEVQNGGPFIDQVLNNPCLFHTAKLDSAKDADEEELKDLNRLLPEMVRFFIGTSAKTELPNIVAFYIISIIYFCKNIFGDNFSIKFSNLVVNYIRCCNYLPCILLSSSTDILFLDAIKKENQYGYPDVSISWINEEYHDKHVVTFFTFSNTLESLLCCGQVDRLPSEDTPFSQTHLDAQSWSCSHTRAKGQRADSCRLLFKSVFFTVTAASFKEDNLIEVFPAVIKDTYNSNAVKYLMCDFCILSLFILFMLWSVFCNITHTVMCNLEIYPAQVSSLSCRPSYDSSVWSWKYTNNRHPSVEGSSWEHLLCVVVVALEEMSLIYVVTDIGIPHNMINELSHSCNTINVSFLNAMNATRLTDEILTELMLTKPDELFSPNSLDQVLDSTEALLTNIQGPGYIVDLCYAARHVLKYHGHFPEVSASVSTAIGLILDRDMVYSYLCENSSNPLWLTAACTTGTVDMLLGWIRLLHSLMGGFSLGGQKGSNITRTKHSVDAQPQSIEEELFLGVGHVIMEILKNVPEVDMVVQSILRAGFQSMKTATVALDTVDDMIDDFLTDAGQIQKTFLTLLTNQSEAMICQNNSAAQQSLLREWLPLVQTAQEFYSTLRGEGDYNVTLPMILSEWHKLLLNLGHVFLSMVNFGENIEKSQLWPKVKNYFHMVYWILNYKPGVTTEPANCSVNIHTLNIHLCNMIKQAAICTNLKLSIEGLQQAEEVISKEHFVQTISTLSDRNISNSDVMHVSKVLDVATKLGRLNQHIFTFNETDPTMPELERLIMKFLSLEGNLTMSLNHIMGYTLLTYSDYFHPDDAARLREAIQPFTNQTSAGIVEAILRAMELLKTVMDAPNGDPTNIVLGYMRQLQEFQQAVIFLQDFKALQDHITSCARGQDCLAGISEIFMFLDQILDMMLSVNAANINDLMVNVMEIVNSRKSIRDVVQVDFSSIAANPEPLNHIFNATLTERAYLEIVEWYLQKLENVTSKSSFSELFGPFFRLTQMQVTLQLAQADFSSFISEQVGNLMNNLQYPIDGAGVSKIGQTTVKILWRLLEFLKLNLEVQNDNVQYFGLEAFLNTTFLHATELQIKLYLNLIQEWIKQPNVPLVLTSIFQWGDSSMNVSTPVTDLHNLLQTMVNILSDDQLAYLSIIGNITQSLSKALMVAEQPGGLQSDHFSAAILEALESAMQVLTTATGPLPLSAQQNIQEIVQDSLKLILHPDLSFASSVNISLLILKRAENIIQHIVPRMFAEYLLSGIEVITTYFETVSMASGPDNWNQLILNQMKTVQSLLPPNSTAQHYVSMNRLLNMLWTLFMGGPGSHTTVPSLKDFSHIVPVLEQVMTGQADQDTWDKLEKILESIMSTLEATELLDTSVVPLLEKVIGSMVNNMRAENAMILSLQVPVVTLMRDIAQSVNGRHFNLSDVSERMQLAIESTIQAVQQANGTLDCSEALKAWEPIREAAGLNHSTMAMWCNISLQPVLEAYTASYTVYMNMSHMNVDPMTASATAAKLVTSVQSLYQVFINRTLVTEQLIMAFSSQLTALTHQPLSPEAHLYWYKQLQVMQLQNSLSSFKMLSDELLSVAPSLQPYTEAVEKALSHILDNYHLLQNSSTCQDLLRETAMILLSSANITSDDIFSMMWGNISGLDEALADMMREAVKLIINMEIFGDAPMIYQGLEQFLASNNTRLIIQKVANMSAWLASTQASGLDLLSQVLPKIYEILRPFLSILTQMNIDMPTHMGLFEDLAGNIIAMLRQVVSTSGLLAPMDHHLSMSQHVMTGGNHMMKVRHRREAPLMPTRDPMDDFIDMFYIDYPAMFRAISVPPATEEIMETAHMFFANPDLSVVMKGATRDMPWVLNTSREETIDAALGVFSFLTLPGMFQMSSMDLLQNAVGMLPDDFPFSSVLKNITGALASESQENLILIQQTIQTASELFQTNMTSFTEQLGHLTSQVCTLEKTESMRVLMWAFSIQPGQLCHTFLPSLQLLFQNLMNNTVALSDAIFQTVIGDPSSYKIKTNWTSVFSQGLGFNTSSLSSLNINITSPGLVTVGEMLENKTAFVLDVQKYMDFEPTVLTLLMETPLPNNNLQILSWLVNLRHCDSTEHMKMTQTDVVIFRTFCSMSVQQWYTFSLLMAHHLNIEKFIYRVVLSEDVQSLVGVMLQVADIIINMMDKMLPAIQQLQSYLLSIKDLNLAANNEFNQMSRGQRSTISSQATFVTISRALCSKGILAVFGLSKFHVSSESNHPFPDNHQREEMIDRFKIPRTATPFCMNMYLNMVNTTGGAIAWAFLKPMLMGEILYTPDTPITRGIMEKANSTLQEFANLRKYSENWIESSSYIIKSAEILNHTLPLLQNSLSNTFVKNFIEMQTDINVGSMKETLSNFSNMTVMLEKNKHLLNQINTLSIMMVNLSSCIKFDRYRGYDNADQLNAEAQALAKNRNLYASVIFKLPKDEDSSRKRQARSSSSTSSLPPKVSYTIRMHMDNVMRTDRVRKPYFVKDRYVTDGQALRYNRGFVYLQENIERAIIEIQTGQKVTDPAVQLQPFPYPCYYRDEYLEAIGFVFPLMLMIAWVLFVAEFVKKLVHEREMRLHEYMKMMGVNPLSHFFAWFLECAAYLVVTLFILTLVLKYGGILSKSDGFLLFLYLCDYSLSILAFSYMISSFFDKTYIAGLSGSLLYILCFFPFIVVMALETNLTFTQKSILSLFSPSCFSYASQYVSRYESQGEGIQWSNSYASPIAGDTASFGWLCWLMLIDSILYFIIGSYIRMVFPGKYGIPAPWYFPFKGSFWTDLCCCFKSQSKGGKGRLFTNIMHKNHSIFSDAKGKGKSTLSSQAGEDFSELPEGVTLHGLTKIYGNRVAIQNLNVSFYEGHVTSLLGHNGAGKTTTMSLLTGLFAPSSGTIEVYGRDMQTNMDDIRTELGVCMQYDVLFDHMTTKEHLLLYGQIKAPQWSRRELKEQVRTILEETGMYAHRHKRVGTLSGGMRRKLSISIAFIGGSRLVILDEPTTGVDPCSRRSIWDIVIQHKKHRTIIMSTHHLDEAEVLSDRIAFLERGGLKCCGSPFYLKDKLGQGYKLTLTKKVQKLESEQLDNAELKSFIQAHVPEARLKEAHGGDLIYSLPPFTSSNASSYRSLMTALDANLDALQLGGYGISDTTLEEVFLQLTQGNTEGGYEDEPLSISETVSDTGSIDSFPADPNGSISSFGDQINLTGPSMLHGLALAWQQMSAILIKRFHHSRRDWKGLISQILLPVLIVVFAMGLGSIKNNLQNYPEMELSPALYNIGPSYSFFSNKNPNSDKLVNTMMSFPGIDNHCLDKSSNPVCTRSKNNWRSSGNSSKTFSICQCTHQEQICDQDIFQPPHKKIPSSQIVYNLSGLNVEKYLVATENDFIRNRYGGFDFGMQLPPDLQMDLRAVPKNRSLSKVWYNPEGHHTMPAYLNSLNNVILRANLPADKDPRNYAISVSSHPYFGRVDDEDSVVQGMLQILVALCVLTGYSITTASFAIYEVDEHHSGSKRLQHIAGISEPFYWTVNFFYDMVIYLIPVTLTVGVIAAFQIPAFTDRYNLGAVTLLLVLFGFATFPWMYLLSGIFKDSEMAFISYVCINLFISVNTIMSSSIVYFLGQISTTNSEVVQDIFWKMSHAFLIFPQFTFGNGLMHLARKNIEVQILSGYGIDAYQNPFSRDSLGWMFISSFIQGLVFFTLRLLLNKFFMRKVRHLILGKKTMPQVAYEDEDEDVATEHLRVSSGAASSDILQVNQLTKVYQHLKKKVYAVKRLSVGIPAGECFGLLGVNGAGKTTTFKMLTGDVSPTDGTAQIKDWDGRLVDIMECRNEGINIGYCPQVDALDSLLTGEEHLYFYARIRGISKSEIDKVVNYLLKRLQLNYHRNIITDSYSCGTCRKLSTALALIGHPQILLLDEPSSGMDPHTKRHLWKIISEEVKGKCAVVLTSHSMEECEALCSRLAIMVKGQFRCLGSLQHIKNRFGSGFTVKMYLAEAASDTEAITGFMQCHFPSTYLKDQHSNMVVYHVPVAPGGVADIFYQLESNKNALQIKHFSVSQTTLDEVFINFALGKTGLETIHSEEQCDDLGSIKAVQT
ncbi:hypothetical protein PAMP_003942 [Pampus punctatissimus]